METSGGSLGRWASGYNKTHRKKHDTPQQTLTVEACGTLGLKMYTTPTFTTGEFLFPPNPPAPMMKVTYWFIHTGSCFSSLRVTGRGPGSGGEEGEGRAGGGEGVEGEWEGKCMMRTRVFKLAYVNMARACTDR